MPEGQEERLLVERHPFRGLVIYEVSGEELDLLDEEASAIGEDLTFAIVGLTLAVAFGVSLATTTITSDRTFQVFVIIISIGVIGCLFFGWRWIKGRGRRKTIVNRIRGRPGPFGDESKQIAPSDLAALPGQEVQSTRNRKQ